MTLTLIIFLTQLMGLFFLVQVFSQNFFRFWFLITKSRTLSIWITAILLLPGTIIHELSHWLVAEVLRVPTGDFSFTPKIIEGQGVRMASVAIGQVDPFRRTLVGIAPMFIGLGLLLLSGHFFPVSISWTTVMWPALPLGIFIFMTANTMFSSKKDLETAFVPLLLLVTGSLALWYFKLSIPLPVTLFLSDLLNKLNPILFLIIIIDLLVILTVRILAFLSGKLLHRQIVRRP